MLTQKGYKIKYDQQMNGILNDAMHKVFIFTPTIMTPLQLHVLSKGFNFVPSACFDLFDTIKDVNRFVHALTVKINFLEVGHCRIHPLVCRKQ